VYLPVSKTHGVAGLQSLSTIEAISLAAYTIVTPVQTTRTSTVDALNW